MKAQSAYIGCILSGKDFDIVDGVEEIEGIDKPVSETTLKGFY